MPRGKVRDRDGVFVRQGSFYISFIDGRRRQRKLKGAYTLTQARALRAAERQKVEKAQTFGYAPPTKETFAEIVPRYLNHQESRLSPAAYRRSQGIIETHLKSGFGQRRLAEIRRVDVQKYITGRSAYVAPGSVIKELNTLKHVLNLAVEWELIPLNPCARIKLPRVPAGRVRYLQPTELRAVLEACPLWLRPIVALLVFTGMRRSELLGLRWLDVDRRGGRILLPQTKNGDGRTVWLNMLACQVLDSVSRNGARPTDRVFSDVRPENVSLAFLRACRKIGIADFRLHDLRHTAASWLRMQGADIHTVAQLLGHKDLRMAARYQHLSPTYLKAAVKGLDTAFGPEVAKLLALEGNKPESRAGNWSRCGHDRAYKRVQSGPNRSKLERGSNHVVFSSLSTLMRTLTNCY
jgi:integrase